MSDPDGNHLVLLGGQDGHPGSAAFLDQAELFRRGEYVTVPLNPETARARFPYRTVLQPA
jgi:penicillin amidase